MSRFGSVARLIFVMITIAATSGALGQAYPNKPLRLIVSSAPGGGTDTIARILAASLSESLGQQVVVDNRPGASGAIGATLAARSRPDGYTMLMSATASTVLLPLTRTDLPYNVARDLTPVGLVAATDYILVVHPSLPVNSVRDLITLAKSKPRQITFSSSGKFGLSHLSGELFQRRAGVEMRHVPYKGGGPAARAIVSGETSLMFGTVPSVLPHVQAGMLRMVATAGEQRSRSFPDLPTIAETLPGIVVTAWYGLQVPAGTPSEIVSRLNADTLKAVASQRVVGMIVASGLEPRTSSPAQFGAYIKEQSATWKRVIEASGITAK